MSTNRQRSIGAFASPWTLVLLPFLVAASTAESVLEHAEVSRETLEIPESARHVDRKLALSTPALESCLGDLQEIGGDDSAISTSEFLDFLTIYSGSKLNEARFADLPASLVSAYINGACYSKVCSPDVPLAVEIPRNLTDADSADRSRLQLLCAETTEYVISNPTFPVVPIDGFAFVLQHDTGLTAMDILSDSVENTVKEEVSEEIERIVLEALDCPVPGATRTRFLNKYQTSKHIIEEPTQLSVTAIQAHRRKMISSPKRNLQGCRFSVAVQILNLIDNNPICGLPLDSVIPRCAIVLPVVLVSTQSVDDTLTSEEISSIRETVVAKLSEALG